MGHSLCRLILEETDRASNCIGPGYLDTRQRFARIDQAARYAALEVGLLGLAIPVPGLVKAYERIAMQKMQSFEWEDAADHLRAALQVGPDYYPARFKLAQVLVAQGKFDDALSCYLQALASSHGHITEAERANLARRGNTASASLLLVLDEMRDQADPTEKTSASSPSAADFPAV